MEPQSFPPAPQSAPQSAPHAGGEDKNPEKSHGAPRRAVNRCLIGCGIGCLGSFLSMVLAFIAVAVWYQSPYPEQTLQSFFVPETTSLLQVHPRKGFAIFLDSLQRSNDVSKEKDPATFRKNCGLLAKAVKEMRTKHPATTAGTMVIFTQPVKGSERGALLINAGPYGKFAQCIWYLMRLVMPGKDKFNVGGVTVVGKSDETGGFGMTTHRGHAVLGHLDGGVDLAIDMLTGKTRASKNSFIARHWKAHPTADLHGVIDNRDETLLRFFRGLVVELAMLVPFEATKGKKDFNARRKRLRTEMKDKPVFKRDWAVFAGARLRFLLPTRQDFTVEIDLKPREDRTSPALTPWMEEIASELTRFTKCDFRASVEEEAEGWVTVRLVTKDFGKLVELIEKDQAKRKPRRGRRPSRRRKPTQ